MRLEKILVGVVTASMLFWGPRELPAQESTANSTTATTTDTSDVAVDFPLPQIPLTTLFNLWSPKAETESVGLTKQQRHDLSAFMINYQEQRSPYELLRRNIDQAKLTNHRLQVAIAEQLEVLERKARAEAQLLLSAEQRGKLRQLKRQQIAQQSGVSNRPSMNYYGLSPVDAILSNDDFLTALSQPDIQQQLMITDEQWLRIEAVRKEAYSAARELISVAVKPLIPPSLANKPKIQRRIEQLTKDSIDALSEEQRSRFEALMQDRKAKLAKAIADGDLSKQLKLVLSHGTLTQVPLQSAEGVTTFKITLHNLLAEPEVAHSLQLTPEQLTHFAQQLADCHVSIQRLLSEQKRALLTMTAEQQQVLRDLILAHNREFQGRLATLLTPDQNVLLLKERRRSQGLPALLTPDVAAQLQLTDNQKTAITELLRKPPPQLKPPTQPGNFEEFKKNSEEWNLKSREHVEAVTTGIWGQLTPEQCHLFEKLSGLKRPESKLKSPSGN